MIDIFYKTVKSHLKKLQIIQNINNVNVPTHLNIFWLNSDKANHGFLHTFLMLWEEGFRKNTAWRDE